MLFGKRKPPKSERERERGRGQKHKQEQGGNRKRNRARKALHFFPWRENLVKVYMN